MLNKLGNSIRRYGLIAPGDHVFCGISGGADSVALLFGLYLLKDKLEFSLSAAHFNHHLRGEESDRDASFVREFCDRYGIPLVTGGQKVCPGKKGLEAAARDARYAFFQTLPGKVATAHTADDNTETVLMHLVRGTGLKGLGGIAPVRGKIIRPMLEITRQEVEAFLEEWSLPHVEDSSNAGDAFLRNRLRHGVMPLLREENPRIAENVSAMALRLRLDEECLEEMSGAESADVAALREMHPALRSRALARFAQDWGIREPEAEHIRLLEALVFSENPSARACFPGGVTVQRRYGSLCPADPAEPPAPAVLQNPGITELPQWGIRVVCAPAQEPGQTENSFCVCPEGTLRIRSRKAGDAIRLPGGTRTLKKLFIDRKIPADQRDRIPVLGDDRGVIWVSAVGVNPDRQAAAMPAVRITIEKMKP